MRGLFIVPSDLGALERKGVALMILDRDEGGFLDKAITLHPMTSVNQVVELSPRHPVHELALPAPSRIRPASWLRFASHIFKAALYARRIAITERVSFIRAQDPYFCGLIGFLAARAARVPFCISIHADYDEMERLSPGTAAPRVFGSRKLAKRLERFLLSRADMVIAISKYIAGVAEKCGARPEKIRIQYHYVDLSRFAGNDDTHSDKPIISVVSRLSKEKRIFDLIDIAEHLREIGASFLIVVGGDGPERKTLQAMIMERSLDHCVELLGPINKDQVAKLRRQSSVCLCLIDGFSLIEAMAAGKPVVAYDTEWHSEAIRHGANGFLARSAQEIAQYLHLVLTDQGLQKALGEASMKRAAEISNLELRRDVYRALLNITTTPRSTLHQRQEPR